MSVSVPRRGGRCIGWGHGLPLPREPRGPGGPSGAQRPRLGLWEDTLHPRGEPAVTPGSRSAVQPGLSTGRRAGLLRRGSQQGRGEDGPRAGGTEVRLRTHCPLLGSSLGWDTCPLTMEVPPRSGAALPGAGCRVEGELQESWPVWRSLDYRAIAVGANAPKSRCNKKGGFEQNCYQEIKQSQFGSVSGSGGVRLALGDESGRVWAVRTGSRRSHSPSCDLSRRMPQWLSQDVSDDVRDEKDAIRGCGGRR